MGRLWGVLLLGVFTSTIRAEDPTRFLTYFAAEREAQFDLEDARGEYAASVEMEQFAHVDFERHDRLHKKGAVAEMELREAIMRRNVAVARTRYFAKRMSTFEAKVAQRRRNSEISAGTPIDMPALYDEYKRQWLSECDEYKVRVDWEQAIQDHAIYRYEVAKKLADKKTVTEMEVLARKAEMLASEGRLKMVKRVSQTCDKDLPELKTVNAITPN